MMSIMYTVFPYGFIQDKREDVLDMDGDKNIDALFHRYLSKPQGPELKYLRLDALTYLMDVTESTGDIVKFFKANIVAGNLTSNAVMFIKDTLGFIKMGRRNIDIMAWPALLSQTKKMNERKLTRHEIEMTLASIEWYENDHPEEMIAEWLSQPYGLHDILWTLKIMFGSTDIA